MLELTADAGSGLVDTATVLLYPALVPLSFTTDPEGLELSVAGVMGVAPFTREVVQGATVELSAPGSQQVGTTVYVFDSWSDGGAATHSITAPGSAATFTASYVPQ